MRCSDGYGESAAETQRRILIWMEFTWRVANGEFGLDTKLADVKIDGFAQFFGTSGWTVQDLFTAGNPALRRHIDDVAFGSLLHTIEDSFAEGHVQREDVSLGACSAMPQLTAPPRVVEFHSYSHQDEKKHKEKDSRAAFLGAIRKTHQRSNCGETVGQISRQARWLGDRKAFCTVYFHSC